MANCIGFKSHRVLIGTLTHAWHPKLLELFLWLTVRHSHITLTSAFREGAGVHGTIPLRAFDLRSRDFEDPVKVCEDINKYWVYDPKRPKFKVCIYHNVGRGWHFHIQCHPNTEMK